MNLYFPCRIVLPCMNIDQSNFMFHCSYYIMHFPLCLYDCHGNRIVTRSIHLNSVDWESQNCIPFLKAKNWAMIACMFQWQPYKCAKIFVWLQISFCFLLLCLSWFPFLSVILPWFSLVLLCITYSAVNMHTGWTVLYFFKVCCWFYTCSFKWVLKLAALSLHCLHFILVKNLIWFNNMI